MTMPASALFIASFRSCTILLTLLLVQGHYASLAQPAITSACEPFHPLSTYVCTLRLCLSSFDDLSTIGNRKAEREKNNQRNTSVGA